MRGLASEWIKLRSVRTTWALLAAGLLLDLAIAGLVAGLVSERDLAGDDNAGLLGGIGFTTVLVLVLGVLISTNEYRHGTANSTFLVEPRRERVVLSKLVLAGLVGLATGIVFALLSLAIVGTILRSRDLAPDGAEVTKVLIGSALATGLSCVFGVGLGAAVRNQVVGIVIGVALFFVLQNVALLLPGDIGSYFPAESRNALQTAGTNDDLLGQVAGGLVFLGYCVVLGAVGAALTRRREIT
jgi:ABC-2 type transport system permease protein